MSNTAQTRPAPGRPKAGATPTGGRSGYSTTGGQS
jgi:hypothetical protein